MLPVISNGAKIASRLIPMIVGYAANKVVDRITENLASSLTGPVPAIEPLKVLGRQYGRREDIFTTVQGAVHLAKRMLEATIGTEYSSDEAGDLAEFVCLRAGQADATLKSFAARAMMASYEQKPFASLMIRAVNVYNRLDSVSHVDGARMAAVLYWSYACLTSGASSDDYSKAIGTSVFDKWENVKGKTLTYRSFLGWLFGSPPPITLDDIANGFMANQPLVNLGKFLYLLSAEGSLVKLGGSLDAHSLITKTDEYLADLYVDEITLLRTISGGKYQTKQSIMDMVQYFNDARFRAAFLASIAGELRVGPAPEVDSLITEFYKLAAKGSAVLSPGARIRLVNALTEITELVRRDLV